MRGSIQQRGPSSWRIRIDLDRIGGKRQRRFVTFRGTRKDAQKELARLLVAADAGTLPDPTKQTVGQYVGAWLDHALGLSLKTLERYRELAARQIFPHLGELKLQQLKPEHVGQWHKTLIAGGLSARTVGHAHRVLSLALKRAVENGTVTRNVAAIRRPPAAQETEIEILTPDQIAAVLEALKGHTLHAIASLALATGLRRGELLALEWANVDLDRAVLRVEHSLEETRAGLRIKEPRADAAAATSACRKRRSPCCALTRSNKCSLGSSSDKAGRRRSFSRRSKASTLSRTVSAAVGGKRARSGDCRACRSTL